MTNAKAPKLLPGQGALHYESNKTIVVRGVTEKQEFGTIELLSNVTYLQPEHAAKGQKVKIHCLGSVRDGMNAVVQSVQKVNWWGQEVVTALLWIEDNALPWRLRSWESPLPGNENIWLELQEEVQQ